MRPRDAAGSSGRRLAALARRRLRAALEARLRGGFEAVFPFDGARCARMADRVVAGLRTAGS